MNFESKLISGKFLKRYKRFFVDIKMKETVITAHCPNTGSMMGLLKEGNKVWVSKSQNPNRKLKYTLEIIEVEKNKVGINTHSTNKIFLKALKDKKLKVFSNFNLIKTEEKYNKNTRFDFLLEDNKKKIFIEIKNVTLLRKRGIGEFPDSITTRGSKHINELVNASRDGYGAYLIFIIQREDCKSFRIAKDIDVDYYNTLKKAIKNKLKVLCYDCKFSSKGISINKSIHFKIDD